MLIDCLRFLGQLIIFSVTSVIATMIICNTIAIILDVVMRTFFIEVQREDDEE